MIQYLWTYYLSVMSQVISYNRVFTLNVFPADIFPPLALYKSATNVFAMATVQNGGVKLNNYHNDYMAWTYVRWMLSCYSIVNCCGA